MNDDEFLPVLAELAKVLPQFQGAELESQLQTFDVFLGMLRPGTRTGMAALLEDAGRAAANPEVQRRILTAAASVAAGNRTTAAPVIPSAVMLGSDQIPAALEDVANVLPQFAGEDLEAQLQTFDTFLEVLSPAVRPRVAALLYSAAAETLDDEARERMEDAAKSIAAGGRAADAYDHEAAMKEYRAQNEAESAERGAADALHVTRAPLPAGGRMVEYDEYEAAIEAAQAVEDPEVSDPGGIGEIERWVTTEGRIVAWTICRYFHGENEYDYFVNA